VAYRRVDALREQQCDMACFCSSRCWRCGANFDTITAGSAMLRQFAYLYRRAQSSASHPGQSIPLKTSIVAWNAERTRRSKQRVWLGNHLEKATIKSWSYPAMNHCRSQSSLRGRMAIYGRSSPASCAAVRDITRCSGLVRTAIGAALSSVASSTEAWRQEFRIANRRHQGSPRAGLTVGTGNLRSRRTYRRIAVELTARHVPMRGGRK
jgi:hypothetical protein